MPMFSMSQLHVLNVNTMMVLYDVKYTEEWHVLNDNANLRKIDIQTPSTKILKSYAFNPTRLGSRVITYCVGNISLRTKYKPSLGLGLYYSPRAYIFRYCPPIQLFVDKSIAITHYIFRNTHTHTHTSARAHTHAHTPQTHTHTHGVFLKNCKHLDE